MRQNSLTKMLQGVGAGLILTATLVATPSGAASSNPAPSLPQLARGLAWTFDDVYRIGDEWGKQPVTQELMNQHPEFGRLSVATARIRGAGTGFYIGKFGDKHLVATNHHVCPEADDCVGRPVMFPLANVSTQTLSLLGSWSAIDFALLKIELSEVAEAILAPYALAFDFTQDLYQQQPLVTTGFGRARNPLGRLMINFDDDCMVFSQSGDYRFMADPDELNPGPYQTWSFANGCDVSHGDSGSALVDRNNGLVVGVIWTGRIPKNPAVQDSTYLQQMLTDNSEEIWQELSYGVPSLKIAKYLNELIDTDQHGMSDAAVQALLEWLP